MSTPVPAEFLGLGRRFREQIADADDRAVGVMARIFTPLAKRAERDLRPRPEMLQDVARQWRQQLPAFGLIDSQTRLSRKELHIREVRVGAGTWCYDPKDEQSSEAGVAILFVELYVAAGVCQLMVDTAAQLPLHALGRWYQRTLDNSEAALISDLGRLAAAYGRILDETAATRDPNFFCPAASGRWAGSVTHRFSEATQRQERILNVRTFLS
jgi:hypothetical protein